MYKEVFSKIKGAQNIAIITHESPDGDAIGSSSAMYMAIKQLNINADLIIKEYSNVFNIIPVLKESITEPRDIIYDICIYVDCSNSRRVNESNIKSKYIINIDHHISNEEFGDINIVETSPSCTQILYKIFKDNNINIDREIATSIAIGIITDTNGFRNSTTNKDTFLVVADLIDCGINLSDIYVKVLYTNSIPQYELRKIAMNRLELLENNKVAFTYITSIDKEKVHAGLGDHEGIADIGRSIEGVEVSIFIHEVDNIYKVSLRSNNYVDVSKIGLKFNGGGHKNAAGFVSELELNELKNKILEETRKEL